MSHFILTIDTEADNAWSRPDKIEMKNFEEIPRFQKLCEKYQIIPTYLLTYEYATYQPAIDFFKVKLKEHKCEIGHHLHVWTTPPFSNEKNGVDIDWIQAYQFELPNELFEKKANSLHEAMTKTFGIEPKIHRAGRWGVDNRTIDWLSNNQYLIDTSVIPRYNLSSNLGKKMVGKDFFRIGQEPFYWKTKNTNDILEVPVTVFSKNTNIKSFTDIIQRLFPNNKVVRSAITKIHKPKMLRPNPSYHFSYYYNTIKNSSKNNRPINMMLHSSELAYSCSPFTQSKENYEKIWKILEYIFIELKKYNYQSVSSKTFFQLYSEISVKKNFE